MKKLIALFLVLALSLSLCACGSSETGEGSGSDSAAFQVGFARINTTPSYSVGIAGYSDDDTRRSEGFRTYIYLTCVAIKTGADTVLMYTFDGLSAAKGVQDKMRTSITSAVDVPADNIFIGATHCHSAPTLTTSYEGNDKYYQEFLQAAADADIKGAGTQTHHYRVADSFGYALFKQQTHTAARQHREHIYKNAQHTFRLIFLSA